MPKIETAGRKGRILKLLANGALTLELEMGRVRLISPLAK